MSFDAEMNQRIADFHAANPNIRLRFPEPDDDPVSSGLRILTAHIHDLGLASGEAGGLFGGEFGYGANYENAVFMLHRYCWCERDDCPWCCGCSCPETAYHYFVDGVEVTYREWERTYDDHVYGPGKTFQDWVKQPYRHETERRSKEANARRSERHDPVCDSCLGRTNPYGTGPIAPNFLHKPSRSTASWYKYIGRGMENDLKAPWPDILSACLRSLHEAP